jgi:hypothetical protein
MIDLDLFRQSRHATKCLTTPECASISDNRTESLG